MASILLLFNQGCDIIARFILQVERKYQSIKYYMSCFQLITKALHSIVW